MITINHFTIFFLILIIGFGVCTAPAQISIEEDTTETVQTGEDGYFLEDEEVREVTIEEYNNPGSIHFGLWGEIYNESTISQKDRSNLNSSSHIRQGFKLNGYGITLQTYLFCRYGKDLKRDFWNNRFEIGIGVRSRFFSKVFLALYAESLQGTYQNIPEEYPQPPEKEYTDFRSGLIFWYGWDTYYEPSKWLSLPMIFWGELYSDLTYYRRDNDNIIGYLHGKFGFHLLRLRIISMDVYAATYLVKDSNKDFWNNYTELGPGIWLKPLPDLDLKFYIEWLEGNYFNIETTENPNPNPQQYSDRRMGILFWFGW